MADLGGSERAPTTGEVIRHHLDMKSAEMRFCRPAVVTKWDPDKQRVSVKVLVKEARVDEDGTRVVESMPVLPGIPLMFPGAGPFRITFPISDGNLTAEGTKIPATIGKLTFSDASLDKWLTGDGSEVDPEADHKFMLADAIFEPGLSTFGAPLKDVPRDHTTMGIDGGLQIHFRRSTICIGDETGSKKIGLDGDSVDMGTWQCNGVGNAFTGITVTPPGGGPAVVINAGPAQPISGKLSASATQGKSK